MTGSLFCTEEFSTALSINYTLILKIKKKIYVEIQITPKKPKLGKKKNGTGRIRHLNVRLYFEATVIKTV